MPVTPTYPGVYIEEIPSGVRPIAGVSTSVGAFIGFFPRGPLNDPVRVFSLGDFTRAFGGLHENSAASYQIQQFFLNGGTDAFVVRSAPAASLPAAASIAIAAQAGGAAALRVNASSPGAWGNSLRVRVDSRGVGDTVFDLTLSEVAPDGSLLREEKFASVGVDGTRGDDVASALATSDLARAEALSTTQGPLPTGTLSGLHTAPAITVPVGDRRLMVAIGDVPAVQVSLGAGTIDSYAAVRDRLQTAIRGARPDLRSFGEATVSVLSLTSGANTARRVRIQAGPSNPTDRVVITPASADTTAALLKLLTTGAGDDAAFANVQAYTPGAAVATTGQAAGTQGTDGAQPDAAALQASLQAFKDVSFNILCIPSTSALPETDARAVIASASTYCTQRRAFYIVDIPANVRSVSGVQDWAAGITKSRNSAVYFPRTRIADPLDSFRLADMPASGTMAGVYARTDSSRGVWKAPAGSDAALVNVQGLSVLLNDAENGVLNPQGINCLRNLPVFGNVCWGARTTQGEDARGDEYKYIPVRRLTLYLEESLYRGTQWAVFEPNDESLWAQLRLNIGAFMSTLFRQGAFQGSSPRDAYFVKCDRETTTQADIDLGRVNIRVGFAPLKPAEFVVIQIQQIAGQAQS